MILPFKTKFADGTPTRFPEKIIMSIVSKTGILFTHKTLLDFYIESNNQAFTEAWSFWDGNYFENLYENPKHHTIRADHNHRWKAGRDIHFYVNNRSKNATQFAPVLKCTGVQAIEIKYFGKSTPQIFVDERQLCGCELQKLIINDGFDNMEHFKQWFNTDFKGKIIHWTDLRY